MKIKLFKNTPKLQTKPKMDSAKQAKRSYSTTSWLSWKNSRRGSAQERWSMSLNKWVRWSPKKSFSLLPAGNRSTSTLLWFKKWWKNLGRSFRRWNNFWIGLAHLGMDREGTSSSEAWPKPSRLIPLSLWVASIISTHLTCRVRWRRYTTTTTQCTIILRWTLSLAIWTQEAWMRIWLMEPAQQMRSTCVRSF